MIPEAADRQEGNHSTMRQNQKGFTLVELIIAVAIMAIVAAAVCGFIIVGSRSYTSANTDIMLQQEAQLALNQISDVIIDTTDSINYGGKNDSASEMQMVLKDSEFSVDPTEKCLVVVNKKAGNNDNPSYWFSWNKTDEVIYFNTSDDVVDESNPEPYFSDADKAILAQHVKELHIDISQFEKNRVVMISMTFASGGREYTTSNNITVRNKVMLNKITVEPMKRAEEFTINTVTSVTLEPGDHYTFASTVEGNDENKAVRWEMAGEAKNGSFISSDGDLTVGLAETRQSFLVRVTRAEYTDARSTKEVRVNIKRATNVNLSCAESSVKSGSTVTIDGSVTGNLLGNRCNSYSCAADDISQDWDLCDWTILSGPATIETSDSDSADIKVNTTAKEGDKIVIEAASDLSARKGYGSKEVPDVPPVKGQLTLTVAKGSIGDIPIKSGFKFGTTDDPGPLDYMRAKLKTDYFQYVFCVRIRELDSQDALNDQVVMYHTEGANERFSPDLFGLELNRSYYVFFQVLDPVSKETREKKARGEISSYYEDDRDVIVAEYLNNIDSVTGKYTGDKYEVSDLYYGLVSPPSITIGYNGVVYPNDDSDYYERYSFVTGDATVMGRPWLGQVINVNHNSIYNTIKFTVYKGEGDDPANWERVYGFNADTLEYDTGSNKVEGGAISVNPDSSQFLKRDINNYNLEEACGTYHIVPGFTYQNNLYLRHYDYLYRSPNVNGDYNEYYYEQPQCTITLKVDIGLNMELPSENGVELWTHFPVPTDSDFPFERKSSATQTTVYNFTKYKKNYERYGSLDNVMVDCKYVPGVGGSADSYTITLSSRQFDGTQIVNHIYGKYNCKVGSETWERMEGPSDKTEPLNLTFTKNGNTYVTYFPAPSENSFPFEPIADEQSVSYQLIEFNKNNSSDTHVETCTVKCTYQNGKYSIQLIMTEEMGTHKATVYNYGTFEYSGNVWTQTKEGTSSVEAVWGPCIEFTYAGNDCRMEFPLPSDSEFPQLDGNEYIYKGSMQYFLKTDTYGESLWNYIYVTCKYTYNPSTQTYTVTMSDYWDESRIYGIWTCTSTGTEWVKQ